MHARRWSMFGLLALVYSAWNLGAWWLSSPESSGDTWRYLELPLLAPVNLGLTTPLVFQLSSDPNVVTLIHVSVHVLAWLALAWTVLLTPARSVVAWTTVAVLLLFSMTTSAWCWTMLLYTESLTLSMGVLWLASLIYAARLRPGWWGSAVVFGLASGALVVTRPQLVFVVVPVVVVFAGWLWWRRQSRGAAATALFSAAPGAVLALLRLLQLQADRQWGIYYKINNYVDKTPSFRAYADASMPECPPLQNAMSGPAPWTDAAAVRDDFISLCPETYLWFRGPESDLLTWTLRVPGEALMNYLAIVPFTTLTEQTAQRAMPESISSLLVPDVPAGLLVLIAAVLGVIGAAVNGSRLRLTWLWVLAALVIAVPALGHTYVVWGADGFEIERHLLPFWILAIVSALVLPVTLLRNSPDTHAGQAVPPPQERLTPGARQNAAPAGQGARSSSPRDESDPPSASEPH